MSFTTTQLAAVETAISSGVLKVIYEGREIQYHSMRDLFRLREQMKAELQSAGAIASKSRTSYASVSRS